MRFFRYYRLLDGYYRVKVQGGALGFGRSPQQALDHALRFEIHGIFAIRE